MRNKKGSKRPPDTASEEWRNMSRNQREADIERYQAKLKREAAAGAEEERDAAPAMCQHEQCTDEPHRVKIATLYWEKLGELSELQYALVARVVNQAEIDRTPAGKAAMDKEWQKLVDKSCWLHSIRFESFGVCLLKRFGKGSRRTSEGSLRFAASRAMSFPRVTQTESGRVVVSFRVIGFPTNTTIMRSSLS